MPIVIHEELIKQSVIIREEGNIKYQIQACRTIILELATIQNHDERMWVTHTVAKSGSKHKMKHHPWNKFFQFQMWSIPSNLPLPDVLPSYSMHSAPSQILMLPVHSLPIYILTTLYTTTATILACTSTCRNKIFPINTYHRQPQSFVRNIWQDRKHGTFNCHSQQLSL